MAPTRRAEARPAERCCPLAPADDEVRCDCGSLLARWTAEGLELKCRRCKRRVIVPVEGLPLKPAP